MAELVGEDFLADFRIVAEVALGAVVGDDVALGRLVVALAVVESAVAGSATVADLVTEPPALSVTTMVYVPGDKLLNTLLAEAAPLPSLYW